MQQHIIWEGDTAFGHYQVVDTLYDNRPARVLYSGDRQAAQSGIAKDDAPELLFDYNQRMLEMAADVRPQRVLIIGGGVYTLAIALLATLPDVRIDVVEIDEGLTKLAYDYFDLWVDERLRSFHTDGRTFLREHSEQYNMIFVDAFMHTAIPRELKTIEAFQAYRHHLAPQGVLAMNVISGYYGPSARTLRQVYAAADESFSMTEIFLASRGYSLWLPQNFVLTAHARFDLQLSDYVRHGTVDPPVVSSADPLHDNQ